jgi:hypothetical protein
MMKCKIDESPNEEQIYDIFEANDSENMQGEQSELESSNCSTITGSSAVLL